MNISTVCDRARASGCSSPKKPQRPSLPCSPALSSHLYAGQPTTVSACWTHDIAGEKLWSEYVFAYKGIVSGAMVKVICHLGHYYFLL